MAVLKKIESHFTVLISLEETATPSPAGLLFFFWLEGKESEKEPFLSWGVINDMLTKTSSPKKMYVTKRERLVTVFYCYFK